MATSSSSSTPSPSTVEDIFKDYSGRRNGIIRALTDDLDRFCELCDPEKEKLCLFGNPNGIWEVSILSEKVPMVIPLPSPGINFERDNMNLRQWVTLVAMHSDSWLIAVAYFHAGTAGLKSDDRIRLFNLINNLPDVLEVVTYWRRPAKEKPKKDSSSVASTTKSAERSSDGGLKSAEKMVEESQVQNEEDSAVTVCGRCFGRYSGDEFWIECDVCLVWFHGMCVEVTPTMAESIDKYECPFCYVKRSKSESWGTDRT